MPRPPPSEFRQRAVELARLREKPTAQIAADLGISDSRLRGWVRQADIDDGRRDGTSTGSQAEIVELRRELRVAEMEVEILKRAAASSSADRVGHHEIVPCGEDSTGGDHDRE